MIFGAVQPAIAGAQIFTLWCLWHCYAWAIHNEFECLTDSDLFTFEVCNMSSLSSNCSIFMILNGNHRILVNEFVHEKCSRRQQESHCSYSSAFMLVNTVRESHFFHLWIENFCLFLMWQRPRFLLIMLMKSASTLFDNVIFIRPTAMHISISLHTK